MIVVAAKDPEMRNKQNTSGPEPTLDLSTLHLSSGSNSTGLLTFRNGV